MSTNRVRLPVAAPRPMGHPPPPVNQPPPMSQPLPPLPQTQPVIPPPSSKPAPPKSATEDPTQSRIQKLTKLKVLGKGTFGEVFQAYDKVAKRYVAVKQLKMEQEREGFPITATREVKILKSFNHPNIVKLLEVIASLKKPKFWIVMEYVEHDLSGILSHKEIRFTEGNIKHLMKQLLQGVAFLHAHNIVHRDLKTSNLLVSADGLLKIADFGLAKIFDNTKRDYTNHVVTRYYRAPELILGERRYDAMIDIWSVGCIFAELLNDGKAIFLGPDSGLGQLKEIFALCGTPNGDNWPAASLLPHWKKLEPTVPIERCLEKHFEGKASANALDLLGRLLQLDPKKRITAKDALCHTWFFDETRSSFFVHFPPNENLNEHSAKLRKSESRDMRNGQEFRPSESENMRREDFRREDSRRDDQRQREDLSMRRDPREEFPRRDEMRRDDERGEVIRRDEPPRREELPRREEPPKREERFREEMRRADDPRREDLRRDDGRREPPRDIRRDDGRDDYHRRDDRERELREREADRARDREREEYRRMNEERYDSSRKRSKRDGE